MLRLLVADFNAIQLTAHSFIPYYFFLLKQLSLISICDAKATTITRDQLIPIKTDKQKQLININQNRQAKTTYIHQNRQAKTTYIDQNRQAKTTYIDQNR